MCGMNVQQAEAVDAPGLVDLARRMASILVDPHPRGQPRHRTDCPMSRPQKSAQDEAKTALHAVSHVGRGHR